MLFIGDPVLLVISAVAKVPDRNTIPQQCAYPAGHIQRIFKTIDRRTSLEITTTQELLSLSVSVNALTCTKGIFFHAQHFPVKNLSFVRETCNFKALNVIYKII
jgi:hypothetical protein